LRTKAELSSTTGTAHHFLLIYAIALFGSRKQEVTFVAAGRDHLSPPKSIFYDLPTVLLIGEITIDSQNFYSRSETNVIDAVWTACLCTVPSARF
jgi:hypothetical protein